MWRGTTKNLLPVPPPINFKFVPAPLSGDASGLKIFAIIMDNVQPYSHVEHCRCLACVFRLSVFVFFGRKFVFACFVLMCMRSLLGVINDDH